MSQSCLVEYCNKKSFCKKYCTKHYQRFKKYGTPFLNKPENFDTSTHKYCPVCKKVLEINQFGKDKHRSDGIRSECKKCSIQKVKRWQKNNPNKKNNII